MYPLARGEKSSPVARRQRRPRKVLVDLDQPHLARRALDDHRLDMRLTEPRSGYREEEASRYVERCRRVGRR